jgi:adenylyltransferase/sulfurtransferase
MACSDRALIARSFNLDSSMRTTADNERYARQLLMPEIGAAGQERLAAARVLIAGVGGLGSLAAYYLAAAGIGTLRLVDKDAVSVSDLNRQILYTEADIGRVKIAAAIERLTALNSQCRLEALDGDVTQLSAEDLLGGCDLVIDALDNLPARRALNRASVHDRVPMIHGGVDGFNGTVTVFVPGRTGCLECLFPEAAAARRRLPVPALGPVVGLVASLQSTEALKLLLGAGDLLTGRLMMIRADRAAFKSITIGNNAACTVCSAAAEIDD